LYVELITNVDDHDTVRVASHHGKSNQINSLSTPLQSIQIQSLPGVPTQPHMIHGIVTAQGTIHQVVTKTHATRHVTKLYRILKTMPQTPVVPEFMHRSTHTPAHAIVVPRPPRHAGCPSLPTAGTRWYAKQHVIRQRRKAHRRVNVSPVSQLIQGCRHDGGGTFKIGYLSSQTNINDAVGLDCQELVRTVLKLLGDILKGSRGTDRVFQIPGSSFGSGIIE